MAHKQKTAVAERSHNEVLLGHRIYLWKLLFDGYTGNRCGGRREWKYIPQLCKNTLLGSQTGAVADGDYK